VAHASRTLKLSLMHAAATPLDAFDPTPKSAHTRVLAEWREVDVCFRVRRVESAQ
jgi:hypothetical protein